jgi:hypothetical protein
MRRLLLVALVLTACNQDFDPADRRAATPDQYELSDTVCLQQGDSIVATGSLTNRSGEPNGFGVVVRWFDGDVDAARPTNVNHPELLDDGERWAWEARAEVDGAVGDLRCDVIQVVIGDDVDR